MSRLILLSLLSFLSLGLLAEEYYVDDTLRVGVRAKPVKSLPSLTVIRSGDKIDLLEKKGGYAKIRTSNGIEGWVKSAYLSRKAPAVAKLKEKEKELTKAKSQLASINSNQSESQKESSILKAQLTKLKKENESLQKQVKEISVQQIESPTIVTQPMNPIANINKEIIYLGLGALVVLLSLGFLFGVSWHKKQVTKRLGGLSL